MRVILTEQCENLTGMLDRSTGYYLRRKGKCYFSQRSRYHIPKDGHLAFILACAKMAHTGLYISDIRLSREELRDALVEANKWNAIAFLKKDFYDARDILNLKTLFGL